MRKLKSTHSKWLGWDSEPVRGSLPCATLSQSSQLEVESLETEQNQEGQ